MTNDALASLDEMLARTRTAWEAERKALLDRIFALETELTLHKDLHTRATEARMAAERVGTKLLTQFAVVAHVFEEAKRLALAAGYDEEQLARNTPPQAPQTPAIPSPTPTSEPSHV